MDLPPPKLEHPTIRVLKYGKDKSMITNAIFGLWDALFIKCALSILHLELKIFLVCTKPSKMERTLKFLKNIQKV